jgi:hypothetical protein
VSNTRIWAIGRGSHLSFMLGGISVSLLPSLFLRHALSWPTTFAKSFQTSSGTISNGTPFFLAERSYDQAHIEKNPEFSIVEEFVSLASVCQKLEARDVIDGMFKCFNSDQQKAHLFVEWSEKNPNEISLARVSGRIVEPSSSEREEYLKMLLGYLEYWVENGHAIECSKVQSSLQFFEVIRLLPKLARA